jgi:amino acid transporter
MTILMHVCPVRIFGEVEFVVSTIKVIAVVLFICVMGAIIGGAGAKGHRHTGEMWKLDGLDAVGLHNGFRGLASVFVLAAFAAGGIEMVGVMAGEIQHPKWTLPRAIKTLMWRIATFYILSMALLTFVVPYNAPGLIGSKDANASPFVIAVKMAGIKILPDVLNAVLVVSVCSVGSTSVYISSRTLKAMAEDGFAPSFCARTDKHGRPWVALLGTGAAAIVLAYLNVSSTGAVVFGWFSAISGMAFFLVSIDSVITRRTNIINTGMAGHYCLQLAISCCPHSARR